MLTINLNVFNITVRFIALVFTGVIIQKNYSHLHHSSGLSCNPCDLAHNISVRLNALLSCNKGG
jgi:hypothetical protein